jgi:glucokinase
VPDKRQHLLGVDVGGSAVKLGRITPDGSIQAESSIEVARDTPLLDELAQAIRSLEPSATGRVGVGFPGLLARDEGRILSSPNLTWMEGMDVVGELARRLGLAREDVLLENDANVAALGEQWLGGARGRRDMMLLTLGTGIGGGVVLGGELYVGAGMAGEIGHVRVADEGPRCGCGRVGCLETFASASSASRQAEELGLPAQRPGDLKLLAERARQGETPERELLARIGRHIGHALAQALLLLDIRCYVFAGGFSAALDLMTDGMRQGLDERAYGERAQRVELVRAALGSRAGWIGAARLSASR